MRFDLIEPQSVEEAVHHLSRHGEQARVIAGGQSLLLMIRSGLLSPDLLISLRALEPLHEMRLTESGHLFIGALNTHRQVYESQLVRRQFSLLSQAIYCIGSTPVRNFGTIGGNLCHNEMGSDPPPALLALNAGALCLSSRGERRLPLSEFLTDYFETCLESDEILAGIEIPPLPAENKGVYLKHTVRTGDLAIAGVAVSASMRDGIFEDIRVALGGVGPVPFRASVSEELLKGNPVGEKTIDEAAVAAAEMSDPMSDAHASAGYRRKLVRVFLKRALRQFK